VTAPSCPRESRGAPIHCRIGCTSKPYSQMPSLPARKEKIGDPGRYDLDRAGEWIVQLYQAWGKPGKAAEWKKK